MFNNKSFDAVEFTSIDSTKTQTISNATQTHNVDKKFQEIQTSKHHDSETQTINKVPHVPKVDYDQLAAFLKRVTPDILGALDETWPENVSTTSESTIPNPQSRLLTKFSTITETNFEKKISSMSWSTNGGILAISYSALSHKSWCDHLSQIKFYEFTTGNELRDNCSTVYDTIACVSCLSYHPTEPSILSAGLFNGDVILWNLTSNDSSTPMNVYTHGDTITSLMWQSTTVNDPMLLVTSSSDGYIVFNKLSTNFTNANLHQRYKIFKEHNPAENLRPRSAGSRRERAIETGLSITSMDFSSKNPIIFIVGTLCGGLYKCSSEAVTKIQGDDSVIDPVIDQYSRSDSSITCVKCSPTQNIFISSDTNKEIRVFDIAEPNCLRIINVEYTITGIQWSIGNDNFIIAHGANPIVKCFDISSGTSCPRFQIECSIVNTGCLDINKKRNIVGVGDSHNNLEIWTLPKVIE
ncbi:hypothetical protein PV327_009879 [Microctonus hyperodae]|uniref:WD repeat-containing protein 34 n=1 Tax=Microctonus hyperodae TaxID=165561 RepID=A0AA39F1X0_MICHY|nr:hypothetical protein PV327_009879 [Microctonus hyperodae]